MTVAVRRSRTCKPSGFATFGGRKDPLKEVEDLKKARQYIDFEIERLERQGDGNDAE